MSAPACPVCSGARASKIEEHVDAIENRHYDIHECPDCELVFSDPMRFPGQAWYLKYNYAEAYMYTEGGSGPRRFKWLLDRAPAGGKLLDIGCAIGQFLGFARERGFEAEGLEIDRRCVEYAAQQGIQGVKEGVFDDAYAAAHEGQYSAISMFDVLEHVEDPARTVAGIKKALKPGGHILLCVPNNERPVVFGRDLWDYPPHHLTRWKAKSMRTLLERAGFTVVDTGTSELPIWEFSRIWADRSAQWMLRTLKRVLYGKGADRRPMSEILGETASGGCSCKPSAAMPAKSTRVRMVALYHQLFHFATLPFFVWFKLYYSLRSRHSGVSLMALGRKEAR